jgi:hypothetical protein
MHDMGTHKPVRFERILIWEDDILGHAPEYVIGSAITYKNEGHDVTISTPINSTIIDRLKELGVSESTFDYLEPSSIRLFTGNVLPAFASRLSRCLSITRDYFRTKSKSNQRTLLYLPTIHAVNFSHYKYFFEALGVLWSGLYLNASNFRVEPQAESTTVKRLFKSRNIKSLFTIDQSAVDFLKTAMTCENIFFRPDFAYISKNLSPELLKIVLDWSEGRRIGLHAGMLTARKGIAEFAQLILQHDDSQYCFVIAGRLSTSELTIDELRLVERAWSQSNVMVINRSLNQMEFDTLLSSVDFVFCCYRNWTQGSNVMIRAGLVGKPVITATDYLCHEICDEYKLGVSVNYGGIEWSNVTDQLVTHVADNCMNNLVDIYSPQLNQIAKAS